MKVIKVKLNKAEVGNLLKSEAVMQALLSEAEQIGQVDSSYVGWDRAHVRIRTEGGESYD